MYSAHRTGDSLAAASHSPIVTNQKSKTTDARISLILNLLEDSSHGQSFDLEQLSAKCNLSRSRVQHLFKAHTGTTPNRHLKQFKLIRAKALLEQTFYTVKQVASIVGFSDISHFVRDYKLRFGKTPTESRRAFRANRLAKLANK
jgi:transcriptional regulator GlxA family with amidase domain